MTSCLTAVEFTHVSGKPEDKIVHTFAGTFGATVIDDNALNAWHAALIQYYGTSHTGYGPLNKYISQLVSRAAGTHVLKSWILPPVPGTLGSPDLVTVSALAAGENSMPWPEEMAVVISRHASVVDIAEEGPEEDIPTPRRAQNYGAPATHTGRIRPAARRRGRTYFGPLNDGARDDFQGAAIPPIVSTKLSNELKAAELALAQTDGISLGVFSRRDWLVRPVVGGHIDNAFDVQRRRGHAPTLRNLWVLA